MTGYKVKPDYLIDAAKKLETLGDAITNAKDSLSANGDLPTLDPLSKAVAAVGVVAGGISGGPLAALVFGKVGNHGGEGMAEATDPYPDIRSAWLSALPRYQRLLTRDADELRKSTETYLNKERTGRKRFEGIDPMPRVPGSPTGPMPRVPALPTVPMPTPTPGAPATGPV